jgi:carbamate kinase
VLLVVALGGNALLEPGQLADADTQRSNVRRAIEPIAVLARDHDLVVTHGNGPQVGLLALQSESLADVPAYPLDILDAESEGMLGYLIEQEIANALPEREVATLLTRVEVAADDPALAAPSKPIGPVYDSERARRLTEQHGWNMRDDGKGFRRLVGSPMPRRILGLATVRTLVAAGHIVVCAGGGGIPVTLDAGGAMTGVEAVIDKDRASALLASGLGADRLLLLTGEPVVWSAWPRRADTRAVLSASPASLRALSFEPGTMGPKVEAACEFVETTGNIACIGALEDAVRIIEGRAGTAIRASGDLAFYRDYARNGGQDAL